MTRPKGAVACGHEGTAEAALDVLGSGGNAVDAAIAGFFAACVYEPVLASLGGGGFAMCRLRGEPPGLLDFFTQTPRRKRPVHELDFERVTVDFGGATQDFHIGLGAVAAPGAVKGMFELHRRFGTVPMSELVRPAIDAIKRRPPLSELQARILKVVEPIYIGRAAARRIFESPTQRGSVLRQGDPLAFDDLGAFLDVLVNEGEALFYRGEIASLLESQCRMNGGSIGREDLKHYEVAWRKPLSTDYRGERIWLNPAPSAGGTLIRFSLELLKTRANLDDDRAYYAQMADVMDLTNDARLEVMGSGEAWQELEAILGAPFVRGYLDKLETRALARRGTTHISVADADGGMVGMTVSNGEGCGEIVPGTGVMFNNMLGEQDLCPAGFHLWPTDARMSSMMAPTMIEWPDGRRAMLGSGGSNRIRTAILQTIVQLIDRRHHVLEATLLPRIHVEDDCLSVEGGIDEAVVRDISSRYPRHNIFEDKNFFFGGVHSVVNDRNGFEGAGDPRRAGVFAKL